MTFLHEHFELVETLTKVSKGNERTDNCKRLKSYIDYGQVVTVVLGWTGFDFHKKSGDDGQGRKMVPYSRPSTTTPNKLLSIRNCCNLFFTCKECDIL